MLNFSWSLQLIILVIFAFSSVIASTSFVILIVHFWYHYGCKPSIWISDIAIDQWLICFYSPMIDFWELKTVFPTRSQSCHGRKTSIVHDQNWGRKGTNISVQIIKLLLYIYTYQQPPKYCPPLLNAGFELWMSETPNRQLTECPLTNRPTYRGSSKTLTQQPVPMMSKHSAHWFHCRN